MPPANLEIEWSTHAREDYNYFRRRARPIARRIDQLIDDILRDPFHGLGKPEPLRNELSGYWSRRITKVHRLVYRVHAGVVYIAQCRFHY